LKLGIMMLFTDATPAPASLAPLVEERGFDSLWVGDHTHIPASRRSEFPSGGELPPQYWNMYDPFVSLAAAAAVTTRIRLGTAILLLVQRDPIVTAKAAATLDAISGGRLELGLGLGWNREEMRNHGTDPRHRVRLNQERIEAMREIWAETEASYHGRFVDFERILCGPAPVQKPGPPILLGGNRNAVLDRVLEYGDGWLPSVIDDDYLLKQIAELRGRADRPIPITLVNPPSDPARLGRFADAGVERACFWLPQAGIDVAEARLDKLERLGAALGGRD
jgi:probable F420-dependent oxidoreductase